jgi:hypothetical protein
MPDRERDRDTAEQQLRRANRCLRTLFELSLRVREQLIEELCAQSPARQDARGWTASIDRYMWSPTGRADAAFALHRAGFRATDLFAADRLPSTLVRAVDLCDRQAPRHTLFVFDAAAVPYAPFSLAIRAGRVLWVKLDAEQMWHVFRRTLQPSAFARFGQAPSQRRQTH